MRAVKQHRGRKQRHIVLEMCIHGLLQLQRRSMHAAAHLSLGSSPLCVARSKTNGVCHLGRAIAQGLFQEVQPAPLMARLTSTNAPAMPAAPLPPCHPPLVLGRHCVVVCAARHATAAVCTSADGHHHHTPCRTTMWTAMCGRACRTMSSSSGSRAPQTVSAVEGLQAMAQPGVRACCSSAAPFVPDR